MYGELPRYTYPILYYQPRYAHGFNTGCFMRNRRGKTSRGLTRRNRHSPSLLGTYRARSCCSIPHPCVLPVRYIPFQPRVTTRESHPHPTPAPIGSDGARGKRPDLPLDQKHSPRNVPTQSPSQFLNMGFPSLHAEMRRKDPSSSLFFLARAGGRCTFERKGGKGR